MSSRILPPSDLGRVAPMNWRPVGSELPAAPPRPDQAEGAPSAKPEPPVEEFQKMESRLFTLERELPERERRAHQKGLAEGEAAAAAKWQPALENLARSVTQITSVRARLRREAEQDVIRLASAMARRILHRELSIDPEALSGLLKTAFDRLDIRETNRIRVRPEDRDAVAAYLARIGGPQRIEVIADPSLERGAVLLECDRGELDASVETQLEEIERGFADLLERRNDS